MQLESYAFTDIGPVREQNEDSLLVDVENNMFIVADGMGGTLRVRSPLRWPWR